ncbi:hypothetical protein DNU06_09445 [Putridiphycobacter roseus]|uniref:TonB C-terminal domain-containing protein n=1 Tax=Putridiphycobacter roseus TaxID=2219161 RepID=A0A2W1NC86_9FLAO|nr:TonB family protein [Putridiphycobacter roseus]PZE16965.1 hypothetical protein DNU06_09445 [Putridiphycobacter roseus]
MCFSFKKQTSLLIIITLALSFNFFNANSTTPLTYLALGDSYTIGESVAKNERWPIQLAEQLNQTGWTISAPTIIAKTGWRTDELLKATNEIEGKKYDIVSLLIGVNNEYQQEDPSQFESKFKACLNRAISHSEKGKAGVFVVSIPDYGYTPFGKSNLENISKRLAAYNATCKSICLSEGILFIDITPISQNGLVQPDLVAKDGLHPSAKQYGLWVEKIKLNLPQQKQPEITAVKAVTSTYYYGAKAPTVKWQTVSNPDQMPIFTGGPPAYKTYIENNLNYPSTKKEGTVYVQFIVLKDGSLADVHIIKGITPLLNQEAIRVVREMPNWIPAKHEGKTVHAKYTLAIRFRLDH